MDQKTNESVIRRQTMKFADADLQLTFTELELEQVRAELEQVRAELEQANARVAELESTPEEGATG